MGLSPAEFMRLFPRFAAGCDWRRQGELLVMGAEGGRVEIRLGPLRERRIAMLRLPSTLVSLRFQGLDEAGRQAFLARLRRTYQRGGG